MLTTINLTPLIGSEIKASRNTLLAGEAAAELRQLLQQRGVLVFKEINFSDDEQLAFTATLGTPAQQGKDARLVYKVSLDKKENEMAEYLRGAFFWHIDGSTYDVPALASLLSPRRLSPTGGQTQFANTYAAYDALPDEDKRLVDGLKVIHEQEAVQRLVYPEPTYAQLSGWHRYAAKVHPLVWTHQSGRKSLVLGSTAWCIEGMNWRESSELLCRLREWVTQPQFVYTHEWTLGDLVIWDNTGTMHRVLAYPLDCGRLMHRTELVGEERVA